MNLGKELAVPLICLIQSEAETEQQTPSRWCRNRVDFPVQTPSRAYRAPFCVGMQVLGTGRTNCKLNMHKVRSRSFLV